MSKIIIKNKDKVIAVESSDPAAGVPDVTDGAGPNLIELQDDAKKAPTDPQAEFDAAQPATQSQTEHDDKPEEAGEKANEAALISALAALPADQKKRIFAAVSKESDDPAPSADPAPDPAPADPEPAPAGDDVGVGEVTENPNETVIEANGLTITISDDSAAADPAPDPAPADPDDTPENSTDNADPDAEADKSLESFWKNMDLKKL
jgi:hypothetical protein